MMFRAAMMATTSQAPLLQCVEEMDPRPLDWVGAYRTVRDTPEPQPHFDYLTTEEIAAANSEEKH